MVRISCWRTEIGPRPDPDHEWIPGSTPLPPQAVRYADGALSGPEWEAAVSEVLGRMDGPFDESTR